MAAPAWAQVNAGEKPAEATLPFTVTQVAGELKFPWRLAFLPDGRMLITEKAGAVSVMTQKGEKTPIENVPAVLFQGQGGMLGVYVSPNYATDKNIYLTYSEPGEGADSNVSEQCIGSKGFCNISGHSITPSGGGAGAWRFRGEKQVDPYQQEHDDLFAAIRANTPYNEAFNGAKSSLTAIMGRLATYGGVPVEWDAALNSNIVLAPDSFTWHAVPKSKPDAEAAE